MATDTAKKMDLKAILKKKSVSAIYIIQSRQTDEMVIAFCGPLGSGISKVAKYTKEYLEEHYAYTVDPIKISDLIIENCGDSAFKTNAKALPKAEKIKKLQDYGNLLRQANGNDYLAQLAIESISLRRLEESKEKQGTQPETVIKPEPRRHVTIIDSLKHPDEFLLLNSVYSNMFYLFGVLCPEPIRKRRLTNNDEFSSTEAVIAIDRDRDEGLQYGQQLLKTLQHSDFFIRNTEENISSLKKPLHRFISLILGSKKHTPTIDEYAMFLAQSAALRSGCLSRQVGAAIISNDGDVISTGRNDVPRPGGGLYTTEDGNRDGRCMTSGDEICRNKREKNEIVSEIFSIIQKNMSKITLPELQELSTKIAKSPKLRGLIEFSRAVHAEMDAITTAARNGHKSIKGSTLYCTTFPCHHCARHIIACGIKSVYYIEPYEKSLALKLHGDAITVETEDTSEDTPSEGRTRRKKLTIIPFEGVAPKMYLQLFVSDGREEQCSQPRHEKKTSKPVIKKFLDPHVEYEAKVVEILRERRDPESVAS